ncbi:SGNH hydrolase domain-containing protein [Microbulbifer discodermiae]
MLDDLLKQVDSYERMGIKVFVVSPIPIPQFQHASDYSRMLKFNQMSEIEYEQGSKIKFEHFISEISIINKALEARLGKRYIKAYENLCDEEFCYFGDLKGSYFSDTNHLSSYGTSVVAKSFDTVEFK